MWEGWGECRGLGGWAPWKQEGPQSFVASGWRTSQAISTLLDEIMFWTHQMSTSQELRRGDIWLSTYTEDNFRQKMTANLFPAGDEARSHCGGTVHPFPRIISMETRHKAKLADGELGLWRLRPLSAAAQFLRWVVHSARLNTCRRPYKAQIESKEDHQLQAGLWLRVSTGSRKEKPATHWNTKLMEAKMLGQ